MLSELAQALVDLIFEWGYLGIFLLMAIESSFIPFPSEIILVPAGYLVSQQKLSFSLVLLSGIGGSLLGALINYFLAFFVGRKFLQKYGRYFFIHENALKKMDSFFQKHGHISTFIGRLIPGIRQLISIPAGIAKMNLLQFSVYTSLGAGIWALILILLGYYIGENKELLQVYLKQITFALLIILICIASWYTYYQKNRRKKEEK